MGLQRGSYVAPSSPSSFSSPLLKTAAQDGGVQDQAELPRGLRGSDQQADQHGMKLMAYQSKRGGRCVFQDIAKPVSMEWGSCLEAMEAALELEKMVNQSLLEITKAA